jgi:hypothetical protein
MNPQQAEVNVLQSAPACMIGKRRQKAKQTDDLRRAEHAARPKHIEQGRPNDVLLYEKTTITNSFQRIDLS